MMRVALASALVAPALSGFVDMDTPLDRRTTKSLIDGTEYQLVFSDEFNTPNRTFKDGHDPVWTALDKSDDDSSSAGGGSQQFYNSSTVTTENGMLKITTKSQKTKWRRYDHVDKEWKEEVAHYVSGMVQSWEKFCFTGGIVEVEVILPGDPYIGGLWPAVWMLGNLGRATYEASTNMIWPWSFNECDRELQPKQEINACNKENHFGLNPFQGRGATEIDIIEVMTGNSGGPLPNTDPGVGLPYADFTLQVAPGVPKNRPQSGNPPSRNETLSANGHTQFEAQSWYDGIKMEGNTSLNIFFYGTYMAKTKPGEPVTRTENEAFQADAVGVMHQLTPAHFKRKHTFRVEWQPGPGGRIDWFAQSHKVNETLHMEGDGKGTDWVHASSIKDESLYNLMKSQVPNEPTYLIMNTAVSSTWGFPYDTPLWCQKCYDCEDPKCACAMYPGFCNMVKEGAHMYIDSIRVYQSKNPDAHVGNNHTLGCDPPEYPTKEFIIGHEYRYMRNPPFVYEDLHPLRRVQKGGGTCFSHADCGADVNHKNLTKVFDEYKGAQTERRQEESKEKVGRGECVKGSELTGMFSGGLKHGDHVCKCHAGYTGPHCLAQDHSDSFPSAHEIRMGNSPFQRVHYLQVTPFMMVIVGFLAPGLLIALIAQVIYKKKGQSQVQQSLSRPQFRAGSSDLLITGRSV